MSNDLHEVRSRLDILIELQGTERPDISCLWQEWRSWVEMEKSSRSFWPGWRMTIFEAIAVDEAKFQEWYARNKDRESACVDFFEVICHFFFDQAYDIDATSSIKTTLFRLGIHPKSIGECLRDREIKNMRSHVFRWSSEPITVCLLPISLVYKKMLQYT